MADKLFMLLDEYADKFDKIPVLPLLYFGHFMIVTLKLRSKIGVTFAQSNPLSCWFSTIIGNLSGALLVNGLLARPLIFIFQDPNKIFVITLIWYLAFFSPKNLFTKFFTSKPLWVIIILLKEAHRTKGILEGVKIGISLYPDDILIIIILGFVKGAAGLLADPIAASIRGSLSFSNNEALKPSFITKISICISILFTLSMKGIILADTPITHLCLLSFIVMATIKVSLFLLDWRDPFLLVENTVSPVCFGCPGSHTETSKPTKTKRE